jgi:hypothetical protein
MCKAGFTRKPVPSLLTLPNGTVSKSAKETANALLHKFFPDDPIAQDSAQQRIIRAQASGSEPPASQAVPIFKNHVVDDVIINLQDVPDQME